MRNKIQMKAMVIKYLDSLPEYFYYHNTLHTCNVLANAVFIGCNEDIEKHDLELLMTAALWHDTGYILNYKDHEKASCQLCEDELPEFGYTAAEIDKIHALIMATKLPYTPTDLLSKVLMDADLAYLGTSLAKKRSTDLFCELKHFNPTLTEENWINTQINFLEMHHYHTKYGISHLDPIKQEYLKSLRLLAM